MFKYIVPAVVATILATAGCQPVDAAPPIDLGQCFVEDVNGDMLAIPYPHYTLTNGPTVGTGTTWRGIMPCQPTRCPDTHVMVSATCWPTEDDPFKDIPFDTDEPEVYTGYVAPSIDVGPLVEPAIASN